MQGDRGFSTKPPKNAWETAAAWCSMGAGLVHGGVTPAHFEEWWGYGLFFVFAATTQLVWGLAILTNAINPKDAGVHYASMKRGLLWLGVAGNLFLLVFYVITRTSGIPWFGPEAGAIEEVQPIDLVAKGLEILVVVFCIVRLREGVAEPSPGGEPNL